MKNKTTFGGASYRAPIEITPKISKVEIANVDKRSLKIGNCYVCSKPLVENLNNIALLEIDNQYIGLIEEYGHKTCLEEFFQE